MAQETLTLETQITFIAGQTVYVSAGSDAGLIAGDTLVVLLIGPGSVQWNSQAILQLPLC